MRVGEQDVERVGTLPVDRADLAVLTARCLSKSTAAPEPSSTSISDTSLSLSRTTGLAGDNRSRPLPSFGTHAYTQPTTPARKCLRLSTTTVLFCTRKRSPYGYERCFCCSCCFWWWWWLYCYQIFKVLKLSFHNRSPLNFAQRSVTMFSTVSDFQLMF